MASPRNALYWVGIAMLLPAALYAVLYLDPFWTPLGVWAIVIVFIPATLEKNWRRVMPAPLLAAIVAPFYLLILSHLLGIAGEDIYGLAERILLGWIMFFLSLLTLVELRAHTVLDMNPNFTLLFGVLLSVTVGAVLGILAYYLDRLVGTTYLDGNVSLMIYLVIIFLTSVLAGLITDRYMLSWPLDSMDDHAENKVVVKQ
jgi:hypothetical protein